MLAVVAKVEKGAIPMYKKIAMNIDEMEQVSGGMIFPWEPDGPGIINPDVEPIIPGMPIPRHPWRGPIAGK